ncbi:MAG: hypothetical protein JJE49_02620 [Peptostreptococcaceae bacterium]|nr:hypothetical protein [Peptostreptococcaceae bacterium]
MKSKTGGIRKEYEIKIGEIRKNIKQLKCRTTKGSAFLAKWTKAVRMLLIFKK